MKTITFCVPCYNSEAYMRRCIESLLPAGDDAEIILINDGSSDGTGGLCDGYAQAYPGIVRVVHQENGGHGDGICQGLSRAKGVYFKVVDSDDWADAPALKNVILTLKAFISGGKPVDLVIANYVYENVIMKKSKAIRYGSVFPEDRVFGWKDVRRFGLSQYLLMHSVFFRTQLLRGCGLTLPKHTFYVDNIFVYFPLPFVKTLYYLNVDFYRYYIGRADQSVNESVMLQRIDQQIRVTHIMLKSHDVMRLMKTEPHAAGYMIHVLSMMVIICSVFASLGRTPEYLEKRDKLWRDIKAQDKRLYGKLRYRSLSACSALPGKWGRFLLTVGYRLSRRIYRFNMS